jgi:hypothetical protein
MQQRRHVYYRCGELARVEGGRERRRGCKREGNGAVHGKGKDVGRKGKKRKEEGGKREE